MKTITSEQLLTITDEDNMADIDSFYEIKVICHDGERVSTNRHLQYLHGFLHFNRAFGVPVYTAQVFAPDFIPTPSNHRKSMELALEVVSNHLNGTVRKIDIAPHWIRCIDVHNNACIADLERFSMTIDASDLIQILEDPYVIKERTAMKKILSSEAGPELKSVTVRDTNYKLTDFVIEKGEDWLWNGICQHSLIDDIKFDQLWQMGNAVSYMTEINSEIYPYAVSESFAEGMNYPYSYSINASLGKKASIYTDGPIAETETLNRLIQQMASQIENIHIMDCGSKETAPTLINPYIVEAVPGMYHVKMDGEVELITPEIAKASLGKILHLRIATGCKVDDVVGCCSTCVGAHTMNLVRDYNVGGASSCLVLGKNSQLILKIKHVEIIEFNSTESLDYEIRPYLELSENGKDIYLKESMRNGSISFLGMKRRTDDKSSNGQFLQTVFSVKSLDGAELTSFGEVADLTITPNNGLDEEISQVSIKHGSTANFSYELLSYIRQNPERLKMTRFIKDKLGYEIDLSAFDHTKPVLSIPFKHYDSLSLHRELTTFFNSPDKYPVGSVLTDYTEFGAALCALTKMTWRRLRIPMGVLQMMILPLTVRDLSNQDYRIANKGNNCQFDKLSNVRRKRSLSVITIASGQSDVYGRLYPLINDNMIPHQYDIHFT